MERLKSMVAALIAISALGAALASTAQAEEAPFWSVPGSRFVVRLAGGKTRFIAGKINKEGEAKAQNFVLSASAGAIKLTCTALKLNEGVLLGSNAGEPGTNGEVIELSKCKIEGNGTKCAVTEPTVTEPLKSELVENSAKTDVLVEFKPSKGTAIATLKFSAETGGKCTITETKLTGSVAGEALDEKEEAVEFPKSPGSAKSWLIRFPEKTIERVWLVKGGKGEETSLELSAFGTSATPQGTVLVSLANSKHETTGEEWGFGIAQLQFSETGRAFTFKSGKSVFKNASATITCQKDKGEGEISGASSVHTGDITYEECSGTVSGSKCPATITAKELTGELGSVAASESATEVGLLFKPKEGTTLASFECEKTKVTLVGTVAGEVELVSETSEEGNVTFTLSGSSMKIKKIYTAKEESPSLELAGEAASLESTEAVKLTTKVEVGLCLPASNAFFYSWWTCKFGPMEPARLPHGWEFYPIF